MRNPLENLTIHDLGNNESVAVGYAPDGSGGFVALTRVQSKTFKTERGAIAWLARHGYDATGKRVTS